MSHMQSLNNCINRAVYKFFGARTADCVKDIRHFVGLQDVLNLLKVEGLSLLTI